MRLIESVKLSLSWYGADRHWPWHAVTGTGYVGMTVEPGGVGPPAPA